MHIRSISAWRCFVVPVGKRASKSARKITRRRPRRRRVWPVQKCTNCSKLIVASCSSSSSSSSHCNASWLPLLPSLSSSCDESLVIVFAVLIWIVVSRLTRKLNKLCASLDAQQVAVTKLVVKKYRQGFLSFFSSLAFLYGSLIRLSCKSLCELGTSLPRH